MFVAHRAFIALRILRHIAMCPGGVAKRSEISKAISEPEPYTGKITYELLLAGFIKSVRGCRGGYVLALPASSIRVGEVVQFVEDTRSWRAGLTPDDAGVGDALKDARSKFFDVLNEHSLADLCMKARQLSGAQDDASDTSSGRPSGSGAGKDPNATADPLRGRRARSINCPDRNDHGVRSR